MRLNNYAHLVLRRQQLQLDKCVRVTGGHIKKRLFWSVSFSFKWSQKCRFKLRTTLSIFRYNGTYMRSLNGSTYNSGPRAQRCLHTQLKAFSYTATIDLCSNYFKSSQKSESWKPIFCLWKDVHRYHSISQVKMKVHIFSPIHNKAENGLNQWFACFTYGDVPIQVENDDVYQSRAGV